MAKEYKAKGGSKKNTTLKDLSIWWSDLQSLPADEKNELWAAQTIYFMKRNSRLFLDPKKAAIYRATDSLQPQEHIFKEMVDPSTPMAQGGLASYFSADWKQDPLYLHLKNIVKAKMQKTGKQLSVNLTDKYSKGKKMEESYRILYRQAFRRVINEYAPMVGLGTISEDEDPYKWVKNLAENGEGKKTGEVVNNFVDLIKNKITDSQDLALYTELIYKCDYEAAFELGIDYYMMNLNKWHDRYADKFIDDIMHFNKACGEWHTDLITGRPIIEYLVPEQLWVSTFRQKDFEDGMFYFTEYDITFGDFAKTIGKDLTEEQLKKVFMYQKTQSASAGYNYTWVDNVNAPNRTRDNSKIRVGRAAALSQDIYLSDSIPFSYVESTYPYPDQIPSTWKKIEDGSYKIEKYYNVWYHWFYIPPTTNSLNNADFQWQAQFIFDIKKNQDQFRYGEDGRFSKSPLVLVDNSDQASFTDITQSYMYMITHSRHKFQNCLVNDLDAVVLADDFLGGLLAAIDEGNKINPANPNEPTGGNGRDAMLEQWKMIQQGGKGFLKMTDKNGTLILDPSKLVLSIKNGYLEKAEHYLLIIAQQYDMMCKAIAQTAATTGEEVAPRTPVAAIEESVKASNESTFFMEKYYDAVVKQYGERMIQYILMMAREAKGGYTKRWQEFQENVGYANSLAIEGMEDIPPEAVGMTVEYIDTLAMKTFIMQLATEYVKSGELNEEFLFLIMSTDNYKMGMLLMRIGMKQRKKEAQEEAAIQQQYIMQQKQADLQIAMALTGAKSKGKQEEIVTQGRVQDMINKSLNDAKYQTQSALKSQTTESRITETNNKLEKTNELKQQEALQ